MFVLAAAVVALAAAVLSAPSAVSGRQAAAYAGCAMADVMLVVDGSSSISTSQWSSVRSWAASLAGKLNVAPTDTHIGAVQFSKTTRLELALTGNESTAVKTLNAMSQMRDTTQIGLGIVRAQNELAQKGRTGSQHVMIVMTDGNQDSGASPSAKSAAESARAAGTVIYALGVGSSVSTTTLNDIASQPLASHVIRVSSFDDLKGLIAELTLDVCVEVKGASPSYGPTAGGNRVTLSGSGFQSRTVTASSACRFGSSLGAMQVVSDTTIHCTAPPRAAGTVNVDVTFDGSTFTSSNVAYTYQGSPPPATRIRVSPFGRDGVSCGSETAPCETFIYALSKAGTGVGVRDEIYMEYGTYSHSANIGLLNKNITIVGGPSTATPVGRAVFDAQTTSTVYFEMAPYTSVFVRDLFFERFTNSQIFRMGDHNTLDVERVEVSKSKRFVYVYKNLERLSIRKSKLSEPTSPSSYSAVEYYSSGAITPTSRIELRDLEMVDWALLGDGSTIAGGNVVISEISFHGNPLRCAISATVSNDALMHVTKCKFADFADQKTPSGLCVSLRDTAELDVDDTTFVRLNITRAAISITGTKQTRSRLSRVSFEDVTNTLGSSYSGKGAGLYLTGDHPRVDLDDVTFKRGNATNGGSFYCDSNVQLNVRLSSIESNRAVNGAAGYCAPTCSFQVLASTVKDNVSSKTPSTCPGLITAPNADRTLLPHFNVGRV